MRLVKFVVAGQVARQHARIGRVHVACDDREADAGQRVHAELLEHDHMTVPAADEDEVFDDGVLAGFHLVYSRLVPRLARPGNSVSGLRQGNLRDAQNEY